MQQEEEDYYEKYLEYKKKYLKLKKQIEENIPSQKTKTWKDLERGFSLLTSNKVGNNLKSNVFNIIKSALVGATKTFLPGVGLVSNLIKNSKNSNNIFQNLQFNDYIFNEFTDSKSHLDLKKMLELIDIDDDFITIVNPNIIKDFMIKISNLVYNQSKNNPSFLNEPIPDLDEELIDFIWHKHNVDLSEISIIKNKKRRNKQLLEADNDNVSYLKGLIKEREKITKERINNLDIVKNSLTYNDDSNNFFLKNITGY